eukprot:589239-Prorocentrum_minimum.AAC.1
MTGQQWTPGRAVERRLRSRSLGGHSCEADAHGAREGSAWLRASISRSRRQSASPPPPPRAVAMSTSADTCASVRGG